MKTIPISTGVRRKVDDIVRFVKSFLVDMEPEGRLVLAAELLRILKPEIKELFRPPTPAEADREMAEAEEVPMSKEEIEGIVRKVTGQS